MPTSTPNPTPASTPNPTSIFPGRYTADNTDDIVVFRIGMRFNGWSGLAAALRVFVTMPKLLAELEREPALGLRATHASLAWPIIEITQHWRSFEDLERYATAPDHEHLPAWRAFNKLGAAGRGTGIWHETYRVAAGAYEAVYVNMPRFGLATATGHRAVGATGARARRRMQPAT